MLITDYSFDVSAKTITLPGQNLAAERIMSIVNRTREIFYFRVGDSTKAILVATWDAYHKGTLALPLWTKDMEMLDMKRFFIEIMGTVGDAALQATGDTEFAFEVEQVCKKLSQNLKKEITAASKGQ